MKILIAVLVAMLLTLQYRLWFADGGLGDVYRLKQRIEVQEAQNERLRERNQALEAEVRDLKKGMDAVEARARSELGMVGEGETFYRVVEPDDPDAPAKSREGASPEPEAEPDPQ